MACVQRIDEFLYYSDDAESWMIPIRNILRLEPTADGGTAVLYRGGNGRLIRLPFEEVKKALDPNAETQETVEALEKTATETLEKADAYFEELKKANQSWAEAYKGMRDERDKTKAECIRLSAGIRKANQSWAEVYKVTRDQRDEYSRRLQAQTDELERLREELNKSVETHRELREKVREHKTIADALEEKLKARSETIVNLREKLRSTKAERDAYRNDNYELHQRIEDLQEELGKKRTEIADLQDQLRKHGISS